MKSLALSMILAAMMTAGMAQTIDFSAPVSFHYDGDPLSSVLDDLTERYGVEFSYSRQIIPVNQQIYCQAEGLAFGTAIESLFAQTQVIYGVIGNQLVLSVDVNKIPEAPDWGYFGNDDDDSLASTGDFAMRPHFDVSPLRLQLSPLDYSVVRISPEEVAYDLHTQVRTAERKDDAIRARVTVFPPLMADSDPLSTQPVNVSVNVLAGVNSAIEGVEFGSLANVTTDHMKGFQAAGLANVVANEIEGFQAAGLVNVAGGGGKGMQAAGLANVAGSHVQVQAAGLANFAGGDVDGQAAGLINIARDVHGGQVSGMVNIARRVEGVQIGLLNVADSVGAMPIGLISYVRKRGYHSLEISVEDAIDYNMNLRLGVRGFYNILHVGLDKEGENWSLGYGLGTSVWLAGRNYMQFELMTRQINEGDPWTHELNLLSQFKMVYDFALTRNLRIALGPSLNVATSRRYDPETGTYGTQVPRYAMFEHTYDDGYHTPLNVKYWVGFHAGIRFGSADVIEYRY